MTRRDETVRYEHTQMGAAIVLSLVAAGAVMAWVISTQPGDALPVGILVFVLLLASAALFVSLTVRVTDEEMVVSFGVGLVRKRIPLRDIEEVRAVRNPWYYGWGIHVTPRGWLYSVSGLDAVEIETVKSRFMVGTDEPQRLLRALQEARARAGARRPGGTT